MELQERKKLCFVTIGYIEWRKGQDILIDAIEGIPEGILSECELRLIGQDSSVMAGELRERVKEMPWIRMAGTVDRQEIHRILEDTDVLICPSREDPMPTVCAEAMMHSVPCLVSDAVGTADYISDGADGMIFKNQDVRGLREKIIWCIGNRNLLKQMGERAYKVYEKNFSVNAFERNLLAHVEEMVGRRADE